MAVADGRGDRRAIGHARQAGGDAEMAGAVAHLRQHGLVDAEERAEFVAPDLFLQVEELAAGGIRGIAGMHLAAGEAMDEPAVDGADAQGAA